ncbi:ATP-dependent DNA helicase RecG [Allocatelliglobosispora scoriae]|uniref:ATP-dependent DNA helicase RecG n=1 Tax=Allocatelliglobosispora scoriae TaxID=643052 RepID=A0A841BZG8_9ACTN|nr:ATP-dependent DNA helicase RecG [Allocatelliglobosispora scoriae]MBB5872192.1 ATP-dependent DNA helicase RecG [Allocatelliglobosispora scoriae]
MTAETETENVLTVRTPLHKLLGAKTGKALAGTLNLHTANDLLHHFPRRYDQRGEHTDIRSLQVGDQVTIMGRILRTTVRRFKARNGDLVESIIADGSGAQITLTFFNQKWRAADLEPGRWGLFAGKVTEFNRVRQLNGPEYILLDADGSDDVEQFAGALIPVYPAAAKIPTWQIAKCVRIVLDMVPLTEDPMPSQIRVARKLIDLPSALREIHRPASRESLALARRRLVWDEAFAVQLTLVRRKRRAAQWPARPRPPRDGGLLEAFDDRLPFTLTEGQSAVGAEISADLSAAHPMHRLLQGEVGAGKTLVALRAMLQVVDAGGQAALLAPTEVLATQHHRTIAKMLGEFGRAGELGGHPDGTRIALVTGSLGAVAKRRALAEVASGEAGLIVGTHALLYEGVDFADLGLIVVDEQHRFGVEQRDALRAKAEQPPHVLVMTATPIPRTVAMTVFGDLEVSTLAQLPSGRSPIASHVVPVAEKPAFLERAWRRVVEEVEKGHQAYIVCPRIGDAEADEDVPPSDTDSDKRAPIAVNEIAPLLAEGPLKGLRIGVLHGRLPADEKDSIMRAFAAREIDVLVATTVIEVGVDVPNATMMMILDADRFGVSQLHQLRGRVGRGSAPGLCLLVSEAPEETPARARLDAVASTTDGFRLAELDLEQRREGDVLGSAQSGHRSHLKLLSLLKDTEVIGEARTQAEELLADDPELTRYPLLAEAIDTLVDDTRAEYLEKG